MKGNRRQFLLCCFALLSVQLSFGQLLWPGDINDNGIVNSIDVLYAGIAYGSSGATRPSANTNWAAQPLGPLWNQSFFDGINYAYADTDGNGVIDEDDVTGAIENNFFLTQGIVSEDVYSSGSPGVDPLVRLLPQNTNIGLGETLLIDLWLGDELLSVENFYGIALVMKYNPDFTLAGEWEFEETENAWYDPAHNASEELFVVDESNGKMELAITRINQQSVDGAGKIGTFSIVIEDIIFGLQVDTLDLEIEAIRMIDEAFNTLSVVADSTFVTVSRSNSTNLTKEEEVIHVFPNPAKNTFTISTDTAVLGYELWDASGQLVLQSNKVESLENSIDVDFKAHHLPTKLYLLKVFTPNGILVEKIIID